MRRRSTDRLKPGRPWAARIPPTIVTAVVIVAGGLPFFAADSGAAAGGDAVAGVGVTAVAHAVDVPDAVGEIALDAAADPAELVRRAYVARWERPMHFREVRTILRHGASETVVRRVWWRPWTAFRMEEDHEQGRRIMLWNEDGQWLYDSRFPFVLHIKGGRPSVSRPRRPNETDVGADLRQYEGPLLSLMPRISPHGGWSNRETTGPGGRRVYVVERQGRRAGSRWWIDEEHYFPWKEEHYGPDGELAAVIVRSDVEFDVEFAEDVFVFEAPAGAEVLEDARDWRRRTILHDVRARAPFPAVVPTFVPLGYTLIDGDLALVDGRPAVHWRFFDGQRLLSVFQMQVDEPETRRRRGRRPTVTVTEDGTVVGVVRLGYLFFIVGDVTPDVAMEIVDSLEPIDD